MENEGGNGALTVGDKRRPEKTGQDKRGQEERQHVRGEEKREDRKE